MFPKRFLHTVLRLFVIGTVKGKYLGNLFATRWVWVGLSFAVCVGLSIGLSLEAHAQYQGGNWIKLDYTYANLEAKSTGDTAQKGQLAGARGELGFNALGYLSVSAVGEYTDFHTSFNGTPIGQTQSQRVVTGDFARDLRVMTHLIASPVVISAGVAERLWSDQLPNVYTARTTYAYLPAQISYYFRYAYITYEQDIWRSAKAKVAFGEGDPAASNAEFSLKGTSSFAAELGWMVPSALGTTRLFLRYQKWTTRASEPVENGLASVVFPELETTLIQGGIGIGF